MSPTSPTALQEYGGIPGDPWDTAISNVLRNRQDKWATPTKTGERSCSATRNCVVGAARAILG